MFMETEKEKSRPGWIQRIVVGRNPRFTLLRIVVLVVTCVVLFRFIFLPIRVEGVSMLPTYKGGRINFVNRLAYIFHEPRRGDVVAIRLAGPSIMFMKRIIGLPGETIEYHDGHTWINGQPLDEPYIRSAWNWEQQPRHLGPEEYYFAGDNRSMAREDHEQGKAPRERIVGKVLL